MVAGQLSGTYQEISNTEQESLDKFKSRLEAHIGGARVFNDSLVELALFKSKVTEWQLKRIREGKISQGLLSELDDIFQSFGPTHDSAYNGLRNISINFRP